MRDRNGKRKMGTAAKLTTFVVVLAAAGGLAAVAGSALEPGRIGGDEPAEDHGGDEMKSMEATEHGGGHEASADATGGLALAESGYRLELETSELDPDARGELRFSIRDERGRVVRDFDLEHGRRMHVIVVRRDLSGFQHLHPELQNGMWTVPVELGEPGPYRVFADFATHGESLTLGADLTAPGAYSPRELPGASDAATTAGYEVTRTGDDHGAMEFRVARGGEPVTDLQPYLGARGHLVVLREGDLAYLHVHPEEEGDDPAAIGFHAELPTAGRYRMYLQFRHEGVVRTVEFTEKAQR